MSFARYNVFFAFFAFLAGCNAGGQVAPAPYAQSGSEPAWMAPDAKNADLLYVSDSGANAVDVFSYPGGKLEGSLTVTDPHGLCADSRGDVYVVDSHDATIEEFVHGGTKPIKTLLDTGYYPLGCALDPSSGKLAVLGDSQGSSQGSVAIYKHAEGQPQDYSDPNIFGYSYASYDSKGDLYFDGQLRDGYFVFAEMPHGTTSFTSITLNVSILIPTGVQCDGPYVDVADQIPGYRGSTIYQFKISGNSGTSEGSTPLEGSATIGQFWIERDRVIGPNSGPSEKDVLFWKYPVGGDAVKTLTGFVEPDAALVSRAR